MLNTDNFIFGDQTTSHYSCSIVFSGRMLILGGYPYKTKDQISAVENCGLTRIGTLPMDFDSGACNTFVDTTTEYALLCFSDLGQRDCHRWWRKTRSQKI